MVDDDDAEDDAVLSLPSDVLAEILVRTRNPAALLATCRRVSELATCEHTWARWAVRQLGATDALRAACKRGGS